MNEQVLTTIMSASSARGVISAPLCDEQSHHDFAVHQVLGATQADEANFLGSDGLRDLIGRGQQGYRIVG